MLEFVFAGEISVNGKTYSATIAGADLLTTLTVVTVVEVTLAIVTALLANVTSEEDREVKVGVSGGLVLEHGQPGSTAGVTNTQVHRGPVTNGLGAVTPLATLLGGDTLVVDVVLSGGRLALPVEVSSAVGAGQGLGRTVLNSQRDGLRLSTGVIGTADGDLLTNVVLDLNTASTLDTESGVGLVGTVQLATLALETTNRLAGGTLGRGPVSLLVTSRAGVRAHGTVSAGLAANSGNNVADHLIEERNVLDTGVTTQAKVVQSDGTVVRGEGSAVNLTIGEFSGETLGARAGAGRAGARAGAAGSSGAGGGGAGGARGGRHSGGGGRRAVRGDSSRGLEKLLGSNGGSGSRGAGAGGSGSAGAGRAGIGDSAAVPVEAVLSETVTGLLLANLLSLATLVEDNKVVGGRTGNNSGVDFGLNSTLVETGVAVAMGGRQGARRGQSDGNRVGELHCEMRGVSSWKSVRRRRVSNDVLRD